MKVLGILAASVLIAGSLSACSTQTAPSDEFKVVTTTTQVTEFTQAVVGDTGTVTGLIQPNQSAHSFDPSAKQLLELSQADAVVINGAGLEPWLEDALTAANFKGEVIDATQGYELIDQDPHFWTSPINATWMVDTIAQGLIELRGEQSGSAMEWNAFTYNGKLRALDNWIKANFEQVPAAKRLLVTNHDAFTYFVDAYDINFLGSIIPSFDDNAEPSAAEIDALIALIKQSGAKAVFSEASISPKLAKTIASEAGVKVYSGDNALYSDSLGVTGSDGETYIKATIHNVTMLMNAWGYPVLPLPAELS
ncbi:metal ABC transporter substrate-binding protein [Aurantimicrobium minutum]|uniref:metal ABC transporter substrate-binding protein n=1 Tax=Aurantimicrobium minutum TaxID=708131 RepID=UPI002473AAE3|nr:metal ABC transporter substrate-binding protein [Aurantimicrobium minutum]MDH6207482.1 ABC-type Zn uptake system ZnuABC Zn-binding protein ZnuA [Aurantimicrobium minutum]MDH6254858.1 ABC-type Zn uptake system ZnuABC Zn-binding protein ZnuA [Aurantimicrobium minutum]MDH6409688.1 ABC-type Zn uptake system ZnuABC Zn-binding protein ZnuA [Aurantimicrobium minutum]MDH6423896.1 ABC-type Zn uptake system ZnuABC Zn-binding protein ZnuA [Aurantimicrobium minutum]MDH6535969.1 ABC-type Zn uptake syste